jgi:GNAT superfamily N-acetyltransferase
MRLEFAPPVSLAAEHDLSAFENGRHAALDDWLRHRALASEGLSARTYVVCSTDGLRRVLAYYSLATTMEQRVILPSARLRKGMPDNVPLMLLGRLAVDRTMQGRGVGSTLLVNAVERCCAVAAIAGVRAIVAHAIDEEAVKFYERHAFVRSPFGERIMLLPMENAKVLTGT